MAMAKAIGNGGDGGHGDDSASSAYGDADGTQPTTKTHRRQWKSTEDGDFIPPSCADVEGRSTYNLYYTALAADLHNVSFRVAATLIYAFQQGIARVTRDDTTLILARMELWCARSRTRDEAAKEAATAASLTPTLILVNFGRFCQNPTPLLAVPPACCQLWHGWRQPADQPGREALPEPPLLRHLNDDALQTIAETPPTISPYPVHAQVERAVMTVTGVQ